MLNPEEIWHQKLGHLPTSPYTVATVPWEIQKKSFSTGLFIHTSENLRYLRRKQTVTPIPTATEKTSLLENVQIFHLFKFFFTRIEYQSTIRTSCGSVLLRHVLNLCRAWWTMQLISGKKRLKACIRAEDSHFEHLLWRCFSDIPFATHHNWFLSEPLMPTHNRLFLQAPTFGGMHIPSVRWNVVHFTR